MSDNTYTVPSPNGLVIDNKLKQLQENLLGLTNAVARCYLLGLNGNVAKSVIDTYKVGTHLTEESTGKDQLNLFLARVELIIDDLCSTGVINRAEIINLKHILKDDL